MKLEPSPGLPKKRRLRHAGPPPLAMEPLEIRTSDGWCLRADLRSPKGRTPVGVAVLAHAMMARRSEFERPLGAGLGSFLSECGWQVVTFDFRGHGDSVPSPRQGASYAYDELVSKDLPAVCEFARSRARRGRPVVVVGHSLGGHASLAAQAIQTIKVDAIVALGAAVWIPSLDPSSVRWRAKRAMVETMLALTRRVGHFPARALRLGSDDEPRGVVEDIARFARSGVWGAASGHIDYLALLGGLRVPVLHVLSANDVVSGPDCGARLAARCGERSAVVRVDHGDGGSPAPSHNGLVTSTAARGAWMLAERWMLEAVR